ncbi:MAG TPA: pitrilysin family protein, partial [Isosphaeraceae bacterium]|nr:pitrilysin family protein [Isosphaeraceae bacterium]
MARRFKGHPSAPRVGDLPVFERVLDNGLRALVLPRRQVPIVVCDLFYPVGSFDEPAGKTGLAHFLEHMLFKGTERIPKGQIDQLAFIAGGQANAETGEDCTHFWFMFPSDRWELALQIEADRMTLASLDGDEVEAERKVIGEERAREIESPQARLDQMHELTSYVTHPYRNPVLGWPEDVARISLDDLVAFYRAHYRPDGAVLVLAGDVEPATALEKIEAHFGLLSRGVGSRPTRSCDDPPQIGRRAFTLVEAETLSRGLLGWHTVPRGHRDTAALDVLADLLGVGRRSRLWQALIEQDKLATWVEASHAPSRRAGQFFIQVESVSGADPAAFERRITGILIELAQQGPTEQELTRARNRLEAGWRWEQEDMAGLAAGIGHAALWGDWRDWQAEHASALAVDAAAIRRVAARYLVETNLTVGWSLPRPRQRPASAEALVAGTASMSLASGKGQIAARVLERGAERSKRAAIPAAAPAPACPVSCPPAIEVPRGITRLVDYRPRRLRLENGLRVIHERRPETGVVALELYVDAGFLREDRPGVSYLTGRLLEEGTRNRTALELAAAIEDVGGTMEVSSACTSLRIRVEDLPLALELLADLVRQPVFPDGTVEWAKERILAELQNDQEDPACQADLIFRGLVYGAHPLGRDPRGSLRDVRLLTRDDVVAHHRRYFKPDRAFLVAVGDIEPRTLARLVKTHFASWAPGSEAAVPLPALQEPGKVRVRRVERPGEQVHLMLGHLGIPRHHADFEALVVLDHIFGTGPGFSDRLGRIVRDELGLVYSIGGGMTDSADLLPGLFRVYAGTMPEEAERVVAAITGQVQAMHDGAF